MEDLSYREVFKLTFQAGAWRENYMDEIFSLRNKVVMDVFFGKDDKGYDQLIIRFTDGVRLIALERGQVGEIDLQFNEWIGEESAPTKHWYENYKV